MQDNMSGYGISRDGMDELSRFDYYKSGCTSLSDYISINKLLDLFVETLDTSLSTAKSYRSRVAKFLAWLTSRGINSPTKKDIAAYRDDIQNGEHKLGGYSASNCMISVRTFFRWMSERGLYPDIAGHVRGIPKKACKNRANILTEKDVLRIFNMCFQDLGNWDRFLTAFLLCGQYELTTSEVVNIHCSDIQEIDDGRLVISIPGEVVELQDGSSYVRRSSRRILLDAATSEVLAMYLRGRYLWWKRTVDEEFPLADAAIMYRAGHDRMDNSAYSLNRILTSGLRDQFGIELANISDLRGAIKNATPDPGGILQQASERTMMICRQYAGVGMMAVVQ